MNNNLLEFSGSVDLIATAICDFDTPTRHFKKDDVVLDLKNVNAQMTLANKSAKAISEKVDLDYAALHLRSMQVSLVPLNQQLCDLLGAKVEQFRIVYTEKVVCGMPEMLLLNDFVVDVDSIRVRDVNDFSVVSNDELKVTSLKSTNFVEGEYYDVQYSKNIVGSPIALDTFDADIPYLSIQLSVIGNIDKITDSCYILIDKVSVHFTPVLYFTPNSVTHCTLLFNIIDGNKKPLLVI